MRLLLTIVLNLIIVVLIGVFIFVGVMVYKAYSEDQADFTQFVKPAYLLSMINFNREEEWVTYTSITYSFDHPASWKPMPQTSSRNTFVEMIDLRIPVIFSLPRMGSQTEIGYFRDPVTTLRPSNVMEETSVTFAGRQGYRWVYKKDATYFVYMYAIPLSSDLISSRQASTFVLAVETIKRDEDLEKILDRIAQSVVFKEF